MTTVNPIVLAGTLDHISFLVPCHGFIDSNSAASYAANRQALTENRISGMDDSFAPVVSGAKTYVPRISTIHGRWLTTDFLSGRFEDKHWETLRDQHTPMPSADAFNVCLLVSGPRQFSTYYAYTRKRPGWWFQLHNGRRDCFAAWGRRDGTIFGEDVRDGRCHVIAASYGRGVLLARTANYSAATGECTGFKNLMTKVEFGVRDRDPSKGDKLELHILRHVCHERVDQAPHDWSKEENDRGWKRLLIHAQKGFAEHCETVPSDVDAWRKHFIEQKSLYSENGTSFRDRVKKLDWQEALNIVTAPWQLQVVIDVHSGHGQFEDSPHRHGAKYTRVRNMFSAHDCTSERRAALDEMVSTFVQPYDDNWSYSGD